MASIYIWRKSLELASKSASVRPKIQSELGAQNRKKHWVISTDKIQNDPWVAVYLFESIKGIKN